MLEEEETNLMHIVFLLDTFSYPLQLDHILKTDIAFMMESHNKEH